MPEPVDQIEQNPSFTSSTYQTIANNTSLRPSSDRSFAEQPDIQAFLTATSSAPVPEVLLYRLLTVVELYLEQRYPEQQLNGLCVGYTLQSGAEVEAYYVSWGWTPAYSDWIESEKDRLVQEEIAATEESSSNDVNSEDSVALDQIASDEDIEFENLVGLIEEELNLHAKGTLSSNQQIRAFLLSHVSPAQRASEDLFSGSFDTRYSQFEVPLQSSNGLRFDVEGAAGIPLNQSIELHPDIRLNVTRKTFSFALRSASVRAFQACHTTGHSRGRYRYQGSGGNHVNCSLCQHW